ncbi:MAG: TonB-dependent receptor [Planctomycetes bacterium]|nr:TonB-dependent receptor [Planctomycetota bacterium]
MSKIDSRIIDDVVVIKGPYSARYGPGLQHVDVQLLGTPRYESGFERHQSTSVDFGTNGEQWYGRQDAWGGSDTWGYRVGYGHRTANDYDTGSGIGIPSSYKSRELNIALGADLSPASHIEFLYLRLDQTDVEYPGQAFDMDYLVTDGYELRYVLENQDVFDLLALDVWFNETRFKGNNLRSGKRRQFPLFNFFNFRAFTDVDAVSSGFRLALTWGEPDEASVTAGVDLRFLKQELDEFSSGRQGAALWEDANSPLPKSEWVNPGLFLEYAVPMTDRLTTTAGVRADLVFTDVVDPDAELAQLGTGTPQSSLADILGTDRWNRQFALWMAFLTAEYSLNDRWKLSAAFGHGERPPSLTELYVAQSFLFLLQNGQNTATGDPRLDPERSWQIDLAMQYDGPELRAGVNAYHAWIHDYITFENLNVFYGPPAGQPEQVSLKYVNTKLATLAGFELYGEYDLADFLTTFATLQYVEGRDHTRNGEFATQRAAPGSPSTRVYGLPRGFFSGIAGGKEEPLPNIVPLESRLGVRLHDPGEGRRWSVELAARIVDNQDRVASSLLETPTPGFTTWDVRGYWRVNDSLLLVAGVENFTDKNYREHLDYRSRSGLAVYQPGANFYFGSELTY